MLKEYILMMVMAVCLVTCGAGAAHAKFTYQGAESPQETRARISVQPIAPPPSTPLASEEEKNAVSAALDLAKGQAQSHPSQPLPFSPAPTTPSNVAKIKADPILMLHEGSLHEQIQSFANANNCAVSWKAANDVMIRNGASFSGSFEKIMFDLFEALKQSGHNLAAEFFRGNRLLLITDGQR